MNSVVWSRDSSVE